MLTHAVNHNMAALMTMVNRPKVKMVTGSDSNFTMGFTSALTTPKTRPMNKYPRAVLRVSAVPDGPPRLELTTDVDAMFMPGKIQLAIHRATALSTI